MTAWIEANAGTLRLTVFLSLLALFALWEAWRPYRPAGAHRQVRWPINLGFSLLNTAVLRLVAPAGAVGAAVWAEARGLGLMAWLGWPGWVEAVLTLVLLDLAIYWQHRLMHLVPAFWRLHLMHHTERHLDATTGVRFHPLEILLSAAIKMAVVAALGAAAWAVIAFEAILNAASLFTHANVGLGPAERAVRLIVVTPEMHRVHHSTKPQEHNRNFGFALSLWDRLFASYREGAAADYSAGLEAYDAARAERPSALIACPFASPPH